MFVLAFLISIVVSSAAAQSDADPWACERLLLSADLVGRGFSIQRLEIYIPNGVRLEDRAADFRTAHGSATPIRIVEIDSSSTVSSAIHQFRLRSFKKGPFTDSFYLIANFVSKKLEPGEFWTVEITNNSPDHFSEPTAGGSFINLFKTDHPVLQKIPADYTEVFRSIPPNLLTTHPDFSINREQDVRPNYVTDRIAPLLIAEADDIFQKISLDPGTLTDTSNRIRVVGPEAVQGRIAEFKATALLRLIHFLHADANAQHLLLQVGEALFSTEAMAVIPRQDTSLSPFFEIRLELHPAVVAIVRERYPRFALDLPQAFRIRLDGEGQMVDRLGRRTNWSNQQIGITGFVYQEFAGETGRWRPTQE